MNKGRNTHAANMTFTALKFKPFDYFVTGHNTLVSKQYARIRPMYNNIRRREWQIHQNTWHTVSPSKTNILKMHLLYADLNLLKTVTE